MYFYKLFYYEDTEEIIICHEKKFEEKEFKNSCGKLAGQIFLKLREKNNLVTGQDIIHDLGEELVNEHGFEYFHVDGAYKLGE